MPKQPKVPKVRFNLKNKADEESLIILIFRYHYPGRINHITGRPLAERLVYSTGEKIKPKHWDAKAGRAKHIRGRLEYLDLNKRLDKADEAVKSIFIKNDFGKIEIEDFKEEIAFETGRKIRPNESLSLFPFIESFIAQQQRKANAKRGTWKKFLTVFNHLKDYAFEQGRKELNYEDISWDFRNSFLEWLYAPPRNHAINNAEKILTTVKRFMKESYRRGFSLKRVKVKNKVRLSFEELDALSSLDLSGNPRLEKVRDLLLVGCFTGLRFSDWHKVGKEQIMIDDGAELLELMTTKTEEPVVIPLLPELKEVLQKYDFELPRISSQKFNAYIKEVCQMAIEDSKFFRIYSEAGQVHSEKVEKWKKVSSHAARRSFATNFWELGIPAPILMQITGHSTEKQFFEYIDVNQYEVAKRFAREVALKRSQRHLKAVK